MGNRKVGYGKDNSSVACVKCGSVRQYVGGKPTYFVNDNVYPKAPNCTSEQEAIDFTKEYFQVTKTNF